MHVPIHNTIAAFVKRFAARTLALARGWPKASLALGVLLLVWLFCLPRPLFQKPLSTVLEDRGGELLGARIASDGQWRFPMSDSLPIKYQRCVVAFEDKRFWYHPGVDPLSLARAFWLNLKNGRVMSGGSTLSMQVIRLARGNPSRTIWEKIVESFMATRLELRYSKKEILRHYAANAPFGGNVVGLEAAAWRYYGKRPELLSWAESATLAVLPNSPALIHPGRNRNALLNKRNRLLQKLWENGYMTASACDYAKEEPLPDHPLPLPQIAPHLLDAYFLNPSRYREKNSDKNLHRFHSTLDKNIQLHVSEILHRRQEIYRGNDIHNLAAIVLDVPTGEVLAYVGNVKGAGKEHGESVDVITAPRSTGSILKPYLYALALESGDILPNSLLHDVPTQLGDYRPENYYETYDGAVPAKRALIRSLNVPFVLLLQQYGLEKFHFGLQRLGISTLKKPPAHYGLSLILGGAEANLIDITNTYACMGRRLGSFYDLNGRSDPNDFREPQFSPPELSEARNRTSPGAWTGLSAGSIWHTFEAMREVERPNSTGDWEMFRASRQVAWKTGTSFGFRDAWAAGVSPRFAVGVWVGNADGEGRPGLLGVDMAAPVLFDIFQQLPQENRWFDPPYDDMSNIAVCRQSGYRASDLCEADTVWVQRSGLKAPVCAYHQMLHLDPDGQWQVTSDCESPALMLHRPWFVLSPIEEYYFKGKNPAYLSPPPFRADCKGSQAAQRNTPMQLIYPKNPTRIYVPVDLDGKLSSTVFRVAHRSRSAEIFWHLDGNYLGNTTVFHQMALQPPIGKHTLALVDRDGYRLEQTFEIVGKGK